MLSSTEIDEFECRSEDTLLAAASLTFQNQDAMFQLKPLR